jgi:S-adenosylmethionine:tRNA ribosyltransferase-isomerase
MRLSDFDYELPEQSIAQRPLAERDGARMLVLGRALRDHSDRRFAELPDLLRGDELLVVNNSRVIPARLFARRLGVHAEKPGKQLLASGEFLQTPIEVLLLRQVESNLWEALVRPGRKIRTGERLQFPGTALEAEVVDRGELGMRLLRFHSPDDIWATIESIGHVPLPPYIRRSDEPADRERYQTVFARQPGSVAAPTAGLHFTPAILERLATRGIETCEITLDVGLGTFQPIHADNLEDHAIHSESYEIGAAAASSIAAARRSGRPVLAVGTTVVRALEDAASKAQASGKSAEAISSGRATADIFIRPGHHFALVDQVLTNFHLPRSTLLVLVAAFAGRELILSTYQHAVASGYRFYSYGDCMLIR